MGRSLGMFASSSSSRIFALRSFSSGVRFFLLMIKPPLQCLYSTPSRRFTQHLGRPQISFRGTQPPRVQTESLYCLIRSSESKFLSATQSRICISGYLFKLPKPCSSFWVMLSFDGSVHHRFQSDFSSIGNNNRL